MYINLAIPGFSLARRYQRVTSTMDTAREVLRAEVPPDSASWSAVIVADQQSAGRGRQGRSWFAQDGSLMATFIFASELPLTALSGYSLVVGVAVAQLLNRFGVPVKLKWPNDVVVLSNESYGAQGGAPFRKLAGILIEVEEFNGYRCILVGIGLNLAPPPEEVRCIATSVAELKGEEVSVSRILAPLGGELLGWHEKFVGAGGFKVAADIWSFYSCFVPNRTKLKVDLGDGVGVVSGMYKGMGVSGSLLVTTEAGVVREVLSGHIVELSGVG